MVIFITYILYEKMSILSSENNNFFQNLVNPFATLVVIITNKSKTMKYKVYKKDIEIWKKDIYFLPTIRLFINNMMYWDDNFTIEFHFLVFHAKVMWKKGWQ